MFDLTGKVGLVTGGATGIGLQYCLYMLRNGLQKVCIADMNQKAGDAAVAQITTEFGKDRAMFIKCDVTKHKDMEAVFNTIMMSWKTVDVVINNAGIMDDLHWELEVGVNISGVVMGSELAYKYMSKANGGKGGLLVNIASILGLQSMASIPVYVGTKHFVLGYSRSLGMDYNFKKSGIRVLTMCPGVTITPLITEAHTLTTDAKDVGSEVRRELDSLPSQKPEDVAVGMMYMMKNGKSGSVWVCEGGQPIYEVEIPDRLTLKRKH